MQADNEANISYSPLRDSKTTGSPQSTSSSWYSNNHSAEKRAGSESSQDKSFDESSETDELMDGSFENATVTKVSTTNLKLTFRKEKNSKKKSSASSEDSNAISYSVQNRVKLEVKQESDDTSTSHSIKMEADSKPVKDYGASSNGSGNSSTNGIEASKEDIKPHQRSDSCIPFRKRKFKPITDNLPSDATESRTSSSSTPTLIAPSEKVSRVDDNVEYVKTVFRFDPLSEDDRTNDNVFKADSEEKPVIKKPDFEFENVSDPEDENDGLQEQMTSAINSILDLQRNQSFDLKTPRRFSMEALLPGKPEVDNLGDGSRLTFNSPMTSKDNLSQFNLPAAFRGNPNQINPPNQLNPSTSTIQYESVAQLGAESDAYSSSTAMGFGDDNSSTIESLTYGSTFNMDDSNITKTVTSQEFFGTDSCAAAPEVEETSIVDDLQKELNMLSYVPEVDTNDVNELAEGDSEIGVERRTDPALEEAVNSILF